MTASVPGAIFDCVVLLQAAVSKEGPAFACWGLVSSGRLCISLSAETLAKMTDMLNRPELRRKFKTLTQEAAEAFLRDWTQQADHVSDIPEVYKYPRDPDDEPYINPAAAADARDLVTRDNDLLDLMDEKTPIGSDLRQRFPDLRIITPVALLREISAHPEGASEPG